MIKDVENGVELRSKRLLLHCKINELGKLFNQTNDWQKRDILKQQMYTLGQELENIKGSQYQMFSE